MSSLSPPTTQQQLSTGSATGNPRNKCALKPGHSLMDWIRLGNSGVDLTGFKGRTISVSAEELAKHNQRDDAWLCIRGKVYNVTRYMDFHPGGVDELMRGVGRDATKLFDEVHAWVNYQQLLAKCLIGPLRNVVKIDQNLLNALTSKTKSQPLKPPEPSEIVPRFDWTQKRNILTIYFYTRHDCNPGLVLHHKTAKEIQIIIQIEHFAHKFDFELQNDVHRWPQRCSATVNSSSGKIELAFSKIVENLWTNYGSHKVERIPTWTLERDYEFEIVSREKFNHDSFELCLRSPNTVIIPPIGFHVEIGATIKDQQVKRSYTPVAERFITKITADPTDLKFIIKSYGENGQLSTQLKNLPISSTVQVSIPRGNFKIGSVQQCRCLVLIAAGSGLTPCLSLIEHVRNSTTTKTEKLQLIYFNKTELDIWCANLLNDLNSSDKCNFVPVLSKPSSDWTGMEGHITTELMNGLLDKSFTESESFVAVCGPNNFNDLAEKLLKDLNFKPENTHIFRG